MCRLVATATVVAPPLEGAVEVDANAIASDARVLVGERENEGGIVAQADPALSDAEAALRLAEEHHVRWEGEVWVVLQWVAAEELGGLSRTVTAGLPGGLEVKGWGKGTGGRFDCACFQDPKKNLR